jgi:hypothetical protein
MNEEFLMSEDKNYSKLQRGLLVEFDFAVMPGHQIMLDVCSEQLPKAGLKVDQLRMARSMLGRSFVSALNSLCRLQNVKSEDVAELAANCNKAFAERIGQVSDGLPEGFMEFLSEAADKGLKTVLFTKSDVDSLQSKFSALPENKVCVTEDLASSFCFTSWEGWRRFARKNALHERLCVGVAGSGLSVKGALTSGLSVLVKTNDIVDYQDISGADRQITDFNAELIQDVRRLLHLD